jgi:hypothetical protein
MSTTNTADTKLQGYLVVKVLEAAGQNGDDDQVWDESVRDAFVKIEIRGPKARPVKKQTSVSRVSAGVVTWEEQLALEHYEGSGELRILLCQPKPKKAGEKQSSVVLAACGIYMKDILEAVPIDKYFELFKPGEGADGGFIRISMNYLKPDQVRNPDSLLGRKSIKKIGIVPKLLMGALVIGGGLVLANQVQGKNKEASSKDGEEKRNVLFGGKKNGDEKK